jgi:uncharacterized protein with ParB-like and HNH nuclease domain
MSDIFISQIIEKVLSGQIRIPTFQRGFVWDADKVAVLMDSLYKGYLVHYYFGELDLGLDLSVISVHFGYQM